MSESIRTYYFVEERPNDGLSRIVSGQVYTAKAAQKKARYWRNKHLVPTVVIEVTEKTTVTRSMNVFNRYDVER